MQVSIEQLIAWGTFLALIIGSHYKLSNRVSTLETQMGVFWKDVSYDAAKIIHHPGPGHERLDLLIDRYASEQLQEADVLELMHLLQQKIDDPGDSKSERLTASVMLRAIQQRFRVFLKNEVDKP